MKIARKTPLDANSPGWGALTALSALAALALAAGGCDTDPADPINGDAAGKADELEEGGEEEGDEEESGEEGDEDDDVVEVDPEFAEALDVEVAKIQLVKDTAPPESYEYPSGLDVSLGGTEFWQRWSGGHSPTFSYSEGTDLGRKCMQASAIRFEAIMSDPPESIVKLQAETNWSGSFFNWNDDYTESASTASSARLWAWRTGLIKWISQTDTDGGCHLPTLKMVETLAANCLARAEQDDGEIQGCRN
ncbi:MAG: hypothetical protein AAF721_04500 [Myxococcota bacterium]